ncbi:MAG: DNA polymerase I [Gemmatimonadaceae bacterium]
MSSVAPPSGPTLYLVDGYALIYRAFFALLSRPLTTAKGENTSAAWGVVNFLARLLTNRNPTYIIWVHDSGKSFRHAVLPAYKATREKLSDELRADFDRGLQRIEELLNAYHIDVVSVPGFEADDVIGSLAYQARQRGLQTVIVSGDKDFQQCVEPGIWLLNPGRGGPAGVDEQFVSTENADERLGVPPSRVTDYLALVGDTSDNVPGVPGIGEKTARELIGEFGGLEEILARAATISKKRPREALLAHGDQARLSKELVTIRYDVPVTLDLDTARTKGPDLARLRQLYLELEFTSLLKGLEPLPTTPLQETARNYRLVSRVPDVAHVVRRMGECSAVSLLVLAVPESDVARWGDPLRSVVSGIAIGVAAGEAYYLPLRHRSLSPAQGSLLGVVPDEPVGADSSRAEPTAVPNLPDLASDAMAELRGILQNPKVKLAAHDAKFHVLLLENAGVDHLNIQFDTMLASYVLDPGRRAHDLELLAMEFLEHPLSSLESIAGKGRAEVSPDLLPPDAVSTYACERADIVLRLMGAMEVPLREQGLEPLLQGVEMPLVQVLADMERAGIAIDLTWFRSLKERFQRERQRVEEEIYSVAGERFNINSNQQLRVILFDRLQLPIKKRTSTGPSTDASVLQELAEEGHTLPVLLMEYRELAKLESTYVDALPRLVHSRDSRLHTSFNQTVAATGRLSSSDPNLQNIPIRRELGRDIRRGFIAQRGWKLLAADYSQIELRLLAHLSHDPAFVDAFSRGGDIHRETAAIIFDVPATSVSTEMRARAKTINFATIYGQGANALARQLKIPIPEAKTFISTYFERFRGVREYLDGQVASAKERGYVETIFNRRRYIPELRDRNFNIRSFGERVATNAPIQGSAADLIKVAMIRIHDQLRKAHMESRMLLQVHDELVFECPPAETEALSALVADQMEHAAHLDVPLVVDIGFGENWLSTKAH